MKIAISGASGFIGSHLSAYLTEKGHEVVALGRADFTDEERDRLAYLVAECDAVVNLAGAPIDRRWSRAYREELVASRVEVTRRLVEAVGRSERTRTFLSASAVGCYPTVGCYDEFSPERGQGLLAELCERWETEARKVGVRCVIARFGVVLSDDGGAFPRLARSARYGVAAVPGGGSQPFSWIDLRDLVRAAEFLILHKELDGVFNFTAPGMGSLREFIRAVGRHYGTRFSVVVPAFAIKWALGEASSVVLGGQCAVPLRLLGAGFRFESPTVGDFLQRI
ncbi:TIGR01777 family oxidoreductase [Alistipes sp.]|uniref:TIGR01777 family oxidoreductase n=1 Tax=Alistipes sp. TaxID=1872444 RepID=UPI003AEF646D